MDQANFGAMALMGSLTIPYILHKLYLKGVLERADVREIYDQALLNLESHEAVAEPELQAAIAMARQLLEDAITKIGRVDE